VASNPGPAFRPAVHKPSIAVPVPCAPRPPVSVAAVPNGDGRLRVTLSATTNVGTPTNALVRLTLPSGTNAVFDVGDQTGKQPPLSVTLPAGTQTLTLYVGRQTPGQATNLTITAVDTCGEWPTFVGGGPAAF
jgi:hypothetical protein